jgi:hypothetical protein
VAGNNTTWTGDADTVVIIEREFTSAGKSPKSQLFGGRISAALSGRREPARHPRIILTPGAP